MKNEIKEILDRLKRIDNKIYETSFDFADSATFEDMMKCFSERNMFADYITNLQEKVNQYENPDDMTLFYMWLDEKAKDKMKQLQEENERLKNGYCELKVKCNNGECDCTNEEYEGMVQANMRCSLLLDNYKSRNEKAIEHIKQHQLIFENQYEELSGFDNHLLDILNGDV